MTALQEQHVAASENWGTGIPLPAPPGQRWSKTKAPALVPLSSNFGSSYHNEGAEHETTSLAERASTFSIPGLSLSTGKVGGKTGFKPNQSFQSFKHRMGDGQAGRDDDLYESAVTAGVVAKSRATKIERGRLRARDRWEGDASRDWQRRAEVVPRELVAKEASNGALSKWKYPGDDLYVST